MISLDPRAKALIFDIDGTLVDTMPLHFVAWMNASRKHGFAFDEPTFYAMAGMPAVKIIEELASRHHLAIDPEVVAKDKEQEFLALLSQARPIEQLVEVVRTWHGRLPMALGTGGTREVACKTITAAGLEPFFEILVSSGDVLRHKPAPDTFLECARRMAVEPSVCQVFEDADMGLEAAARAGMIPCDVRPYLVRREPAASG